MSVVKSRLFLITVLIFGFGFSVPVYADNVSDIAPQAGPEQPQYAVSLHGSPKYAPDFEHVDYVNPDAPKGGVLRQHVEGTFDSLNPFIVKGTPAAGLNFIRSGLLYESLMQNAWDEPFTLYGVIAKDITIAADQSWVRFRLRDEARWHDGQPITADDVIWTFETLTTKGQPFFKAYWGDVESIKAEDEKTVTFTFGVTGNAELPLIIAEMVVLPKHYWTAEGRNFDETSLEPPLGSGPYKIGKIDAGRSIEYIRHDGWWGKDLAFFKGMNNFDRLVYDYYRDANVAHEAFLAQNFDVKMENIAKQWFEGYSVAGAKKDNLVQEEIDNSRPSGMQGFAYNIRRPLFQDVKLREALGYAFDFEWSNKQFAFNSYIRTNSFFDNSELASSDLPSAAELEVLEPLRGQIPERVFTIPFMPPVTDGTGNVRNNLRTAVQLLQEAGYTALDEDKIRFKILPDGRKQRLEFEILYFTNTFERWVLPFIKNLERIGVKANLRVVDPAQYQQRISSFDFDVTIAIFGQSSSPGNEQRDFWGSGKADLQGSRNIIGIKDPAIDQLITHVIHATSREDLVIKTRALDRVLLSHHFVIPMWHYPKWRIAYWDHIQRPKQLSGIAPLFTQTWWMRPDAAPSRAFQD